MTKVEFIQHNVTLLDYLLSRGALCFYNSASNDEFSGMDWHYRHNLSYDEISMIEGAGMVVGEVGQADEGGLRISILFEDDLKKLNGK